MLSVIINYKRHRAVNSEGYNGLSAERSIGNLLVLLFDTTHATDSDVGGDKWGLFSLC